MPNGSTTDGASLQQFAWWTGGPQKWEIIENSDRAEQSSASSRTQSGDGTYRIRNVSSGGVVTVNGGSTTDGADIIQWPWLENANQVWDLTFIETVQPTDDGRPW